MDRLSADAANCASKRKVRVFRISDNRKKMTPVNLEAILFLKANKKLWDAQVVKQATEKISEDQQ